MCVFHDIFSVQMAFFVSIRAPFSAKRRNMALRRTSPYMSLSRLVPHATSHISPPHCYQYIGFTSDPFVSVRSRIVCHSVVHLRPRGWKATSGLRK